MIAAALLVEIERYAAIFPTECAFYRRAAEGALTPAHAARYLANIRFHILANMQLLKRCRDVSAARGESALVAHFEHKLDEELGHDAWADEDLAALRARTATDESIVPAMIELCAGLAPIVEEDPVLWLAHTLFAEELTARFGSEIVALFDGRAGVPEAEMTVITKHVEADRDHVWEALDRIDDLCGDPAKLPRLREVLVRSQELFLRFCEEVAEAAPRSERIVAESGLIPTDWVEASDAIISAA